MAKKSQNELELEFTVDNIANVFIQTINGYIKKGVAIILTVLTIGQTYTLMKESEYNNQRASLSFQGQLNNPMKDFSELDVSNDVIMKMEEIENEGYYVHQREDIEFINHYDSVKDTFKDAEGKEWLGYGLVDSYTADSAFYVKQGDGSNLQLELVEDTKDDIILARDASLIDVDDSVVIETRMVTKQMLSTSKEVHDYRNVGSYIANPYDEIFRYHDQPVIQFDEDGNQVYVIMDKAVNFSDHIANQKNGASGFVGTVEGVEYSEGNGVPLLESGAELMENKTM